MYIDSETYEIIKSSLPISCVDVLIVKNNKFLLCKRTQKPAQGQWWFPGGRILFGELLENAGVRKCLEEVGLNVEVGKIIAVEESIFEHPKVHTINVVVEATLVGPDDLIVLDDTQSEYCWFEYIDHDWHQCVKNPLRKRGFNFSDD